MEAFIVQAIGILECAQVRVQMTSSLLSDTLLGGVNIHLYCNNDHSYIRECTGRSANECLCVYEKKDRDNTKRKDIHPPPTPIMAVIKLFPLFWFSRLAYSAYRPKRKLSDVKEICVYRFEG